jgi:hypothetical protein
VIVRKRKRAVLIAALAGQSGAAERSGTLTFLARVPVLSFFMPHADEQLLDAIEPEKEEAPRPANMVNGAGAQAKEARDVGALRSTGLLVEHSDMQRAFRVFLRVLTVLFLSVALHYVKADVAIGHILMAGRADGSEEPSRRVQLQAS